MNQTTASLLALLVITSTALGGTSATSGKSCQSCTAPTPQDDSLGLSLEARYHTHYLFRGVQFGEHWVDGSVDFSLPLTETTRLDFGAHYGLLAGEDSVLNDLAGADLSYRRLELATHLVTQVGAVEIGAGYRYYWHDGDLADLLEDSHEVSVMAATQLSIVTIGLGAHYDITNDGWYLEARAATEWKLSERLSLVPSVGIGYAVDYDWQVATDLGKRDGFTAVNLTVSAPFQLLKNLTLTPYIAANLPIDALEDAGEDEELFGGLSITLRF